MRKTTSPRLNLTWWTSSMLGVTVPPSHRSAKWPTYLRVRFHVFIFCRISYIQGGKFSLSNKKSTNLCGCKSYLFHVNNYMSSTNVLSVSGDRYIWIRGTQNGYWAPSTLMHLQSVWGKMLASAGLILSYF